MARLAGERLNSAAGRSEISGADVVTALAALGGIGGLTVTGIASLLDYFTGDARIYDSGEYLANSAITAIPLGTAAAGAALMGANDPVARNMMGVMGDVAAARNAGREYGAEAILASLDPEAASVPNRAQIEDAANRVNAGKQRLAEVLRERIQSDPKMAGMAPEQAAQLLLKRGAHGLGRGAGIGALAGSVPAVMLMMDAPAEPNKKEGR